MIVSCLLHPRPFRAPPSSPAFPQSLLKQVRSLWTGIPATTQKRNEQAERVDLLTKESITNSVPASTSALSPLSRGTSLLVAIRTINRTIG